MKYTGNKISSLSACHMHLTLGLISHTTHNLTDKMSKTEVELSFFIFKC